MYRQNTDISWRVSCHAHEGGTLSVRCVHNKINTFMYRCVLVCGVGYHDDGYGRHRNMSQYILTVCKECHDKWVPLTTAWRVLRLRMEERPPIWRVAANILNKQWRTALKGWSFILVFGQVLTNPHRNNVSCCGTFIE